MIGCKCGKVYVIVIVMVKDFFVGCIVDFVQGVKD